MTADGSDPRLARSRALLLDAATDLLRTRGPSAVTIDAVIRHATVARATLYRHFPSLDDLIATAFMRLMPPVPMPPEEGTLRERLISVVAEWADALAEAPTMPTAMVWLSLGPYISEIPGADGAVVSLRERISEQFSAPLAAIFDQTDAAECRERIDRTTALALLIGPLIFGRISTVAEFDYRATAVVAVDGFMARLATGFG